MPVKGALRVIFTIYKDKAAEFAQEKQYEGKKKMSIGTQDKTDAN